MIDPAAFQQWFVGFMQQFAEGGGDAVVLAADGKTLRRSYDRPGGATLPAASGQRLGRGAAAGVRIGQQTVAAKSNAITALPQLLAMLTLRGKVATADAMHCQRQAAWRSR